MKDEEIISEPVAVHAVAESQLKSLALLPRKIKYTLYEYFVNNYHNNNNNNNDFITSIYHNISSKPIFKLAEDDMELLSDIVTWGERYLNHWEKGIYRCSRCMLLLYRSEDKYKGPCVWPSFRRGVDENISTRTVSPYNNYTVMVKEIYCRGCDLFIGHQFEDAAAKGDTHPQARWRH